MNWEWFIYNWEELPKEDLYDILALRVDIFVVEQNCPYPEIDGKDRQSWHLLAKSRGDISGYLRMVEPGTIYDELAIGRVVVGEAFRGKGLGHSMMEEALKFVEKQWGGVPIRLGAQEHLKAFYEAHGFEQVSDSYLEDGIPHIEMLRKFTS